MPEKLSIGDRAPEFSLSDKDGTEHALADIKSESTVVYFYPRDNTPGCTLEAQAFNEALKEFKKRKVSVVGISGGDEKSKTKFCDKYDLKILLLSDPDFSVAKAYGAYGPKSFMGRKFNGIFRKTFVLNKNGKIVRIYDQVKPAVHAREILKDLQAK